MPVSLVTEHLYVAWHWEAFLGSTDITIHIGWAKSQDEQHLVPANVFPFPFLISSLLPRSVYSCSRSPSMYDQRNVELKEQLRSDVL